MATITSFINGGSGAGEFSTIAAWEADKDGTSSATDTEVLEISIVGSESGTIDIAGWTDKTGGNLIIIEWLGDAFHAGLLNRSSSNVYITERIRISEPSMTLIGAFGDLALGTQTSCFDINSVADGGTIKYINCIADCNGEAADGFKGNTGATSNVFCFNCVSMNTATGPGDNTFSNAHGGTYESYNCIAYNSGRGWNVGTVFNSWSLENAVQDLRNVSASFSIWNTESGVTNVTGNNDAGLLIDDGVEAANTINVASLTAGSEDFTPEEFSTTVTDSNIAIEAGFDYSGTHSELDNDITGQARGSSPSIGAYEVVAAGGATVPIFDHHNRMMAA